MQGTIYSLLCFGLSAQHHWYDSVKQVAAAQKSDTNKVQTLITLCDAYAFSYPDTALVYGNLAYELSGKLDYDRGRLYSIISINCALYAMNNYTQELEYAFKLIPLSKRMDDLNAKGFSFGTVGDSYLNFGEYSVALKYYKEVLKIGISNKLPELHRMYSGLAPVYLGLKQYDSALFYVKKGYELFKTSPYYLSNDWNTKWSESGLYNALGDVFTASKAFDSALYYYRLGIPSSKYVGHQYNILAAFAGMATAFKAQLKFDSAKIYAQKVLGENNTALYPMGRQKAAGLLAEIYDLQHNPDSALKYLRITMQLKDSFYNQEKMMSFQNILFKENEKEWTIETATADLKRRYRYYFITAAFILVLSITALVIRNRRRQQLERMRNNIADDLHDDIGSTLSSIRIINELAKIRSPEALPLLTAIGENTAAIQENMSDIIWTVNPNNDHFENIVLRMNLFAAEIVDAQKIQLSFNSDESLNEARLTMRQRKNIYLFFKEAINNAAKYSGAGTIDVNITRKDHHIELSISDDGKGFDLSSTPCGNGLNSLKKRAEELQAKYHIHSQPGIGTTIRLKFRIAHGN